MPVHSIFNTLLSELGRTYKTFPFTMTATISPMEISDDDDELSDTDTCIYRDQDIDSSGLL